MRFVLYILLSFFFYYPTLWANPTDILQKLPNDFKSQCFEKYIKIPRTQLKEFNTYKLNTDENNIYATQFGYLLPIKNFQWDENYYQYSINYNFQEIEVKDDKWDITDSFSTKKYLQDNNEKTYITHTLDTPIASLNITFDNIINAWDTRFNFHYFSNHYSTRYTISTDGKTYSQIPRSEINEHDYKYLKIEFIALSEPHNKENIKIYELSFPKNQSTHLIKSFYNADIELYSWYKCQEELYLTAKKYDNFSIDTNTQSLEYTFWENPKYNIYTKIDSDNDWIEDAIDNCKNHYNPDQKDSNGDGKWDMCSDDDKDNIIGFYDNCPYIYNAFQKDVNNNWVWDSCEFDKDEDGVFDSIDNCMTIKNPDQKDDDYDGIWNACDNCEFYNPAQWDKNQNSIWDVCDYKIEQLKKNDKDLDKIHDNVDNCKFIANPDQVDSDDDGIGDACDNCKNIDNPKQEDLNKNNIWDICEDSDFDGIIGYLDNCIHVSNADQADDNNNGIGNVCEDIDKDQLLAYEDNCPFNYNPDQKDTDNDGIWDSCDQIDDRFIESNKEFFIVLLIAIILVFIAGIISMFKKLKNLNL